MSPIAWSRKAWTAYWFRPAPLVDLAVLRLLVVGFQLHRLLTGAYPRRLAELAALPDALYYPLPILRLFTLPFGHGFRPPLELALGAYWLTVAAGVPALIGLRTNASLALFAAGNVFVQAFAYSFGDYHHPEALVMIALAALALSPAGEALSVDDLRRRLARAVRLRRAGTSSPLGARSPLARWPLLLVRWLLALAYLSAAKSKLETAGLDWVNGYTLQYYALRDGLRWGSDLGVRLGGHHELARLASWGAVLFEGTFLLVLVAPALACLYVPAGVAFHTSIYLVQRAPFFQFVVLYGAFVPWTSLAARLSRRRRTRPDARLTVLYDGRCPVCIRSMTTLRYLDWLDRLRPMDLERLGPDLAATRPDLSLEACRREMHVLLPDGTVRRGFFAFRVLFRRLPPLWPLLVLFHLPGASLVGPRIYRMVAARRRRLEPCADGTCDLPPSDRPR